GGRRAVLVAMAGAVRARSRLRSRLSGYVVGHGEHLLEDAGAGPRQLVARRVARSDLSDRGIRRRETPVGPRVSTRRRRPAVGDVCAGGTYWVGSFQERSRLRNPRD